MFDLEKLPTYKNFQILPELFEVIINFTLAHPNVQQLMSEQFDAVIVEVFHSEALLGNLNLNRKLNPSSFKRLRARRALQMSNHRRFHLRNFHVH